MTMAAVQQIVAVPTPPPATAPAPAPIPTTASAPARPMSINGSLPNEPSDDVEMAVDSDPQPTALENGARFGSGPQRGDTRIVTIVYGPGQDRILSVFAEVLGQPFRLRSGFGDVTPADEGTVVGILASNASAGDGAGAGTDSKINITTDITSRDKGLVVAINAHCVESGMPPDPHISANCDYEFLYTNTPYLRRDLTRFISFVLGQINHHETLMAKPRTFMISTTFPDVSAALPNIDILTVGADAVELRVDLLRETLPDGTYAAVPSLSYVGKQVMLLRQRTELPIIFTTRCTHENGRFPMDDPSLYHSYLYRAIQWGVEYIDVEVWLPEPTRRDLNDRKGSSRIMSAFHDFSGTFRWPSDRARRVFLESTRFADIVKMIAIINDHNENFELEYFRSRMRDEYPRAPPLSAVNMGETGQFSRTMNRVFTPITHPLLPLIAAPGQMSAAEINAALALLGQLPKKNIYGISGPSGSRGAAAPQAPFYEKCFNELGLPHHFAVVERPVMRGLQRKSGGVGVGTPPHPSAPSFHLATTAPAAVTTPATTSTGIEAWCNQKNFGGAYLTPPVSHHALVSNSAFFQSLNGGTGPVLTEAARLIGMVDTIVVRAGPSPTASPSPPSPVPSTPSPVAGHPSHPHPHSHPHAPPTSSPLLSSPPGGGSGGGGGGGGGGGSGLPPSTPLVFDNAAWRGILSTLTRDLAPSAYFGCSAVVLASSADDAASAVFALRELRVGKLFTVGFRVPAPLARGLDVEPFNSLESLQRARAFGGAGSGTGAGAGAGHGHGEGGGSDSPPFVVVSALGPEKATLVGMLVRLFGSSSSSSSSSSSTSTSTVKEEEQQQQRRRKKVFLDLADIVGSGGSSWLSSSSLSSSTTTTTAAAAATSNSHSSTINNSSSRRATDPALVAEQYGFGAYGAADAAAFTTVETLRLLVGQNVPYSFVRLASGRVLY